MNVGLILAWTVAALDTCAGIGYFCVGDWKRGLMWFCWGVATTALNLVK